MRLRRNDLEQARQQYRQALIVLRETAPGSVFLAGALPYAASGLPPGTARPGATPVLPARLFDHAPAILSRDVAAGVGADANDGSSAGCC
jgi:hypothetical protein